ncbi:MAG: methionine adenosyltransferase [Halobacteriales archaeon]
MVERNVRVTTFDRPAVGDQSVEIVERKGLGHPDSLCDGIAESVGQALARAYLERFGRVLHFNTDETQLVAGTAEPALGGGETLRPIYVLIVGRATKQYRGEPFPAERIALRAARAYLERTVPRLTVGSDVVLDVRLGEGSGDLKTVFGGEGRSIPAANDTSFGVGHAPLSDTERVVLETERQLNDRYAEATPALGPDIKVMGKREDDVLDLTVAAAIIDEHVADVAEYEAAVDGIEAFVRDLASRETDLDVEVAVNTADDFGEESLYITVSGTSAENGDDGSVGRGNRSNGLITPNRSMSLEATSGKNPVNHIGKIYNVLATEIARTTVERVDGIRDLRIRLLSQIGQPIDQPQIADAHVVPEPGVSVESLEGPVAREVDRGLAEIDRITERLIAGELTTF